MAHARGMLVRHPLRADRIQGGAAKRRPNSSEADPHSRPADRVRTEEITLDIVSPIQGGSSAERDTRAALGRSRGGYGTKGCVIADGLGRAVAFILAPGQAHELPHAVPLLEPLPGVPKWVGADRGFSSHAFREHIWERGARPATPAKDNEAPVACPDWIYNNRSPVERLWARLKEGRAIATRDAKTASSSLPQASCLKLHRRPLPCRRSRLPQALTGPRPA